MSKCSYGAVRVLWVACLGVVMSISNSGYSYPQIGNGHKSEAELSRMSAEQHVNEYCREYARHDVSHMEYGNLLADYIMLDGLKAIPALVKAINEFDPTRSTSKGEKDRVCEAAEVMLSDIDQHVVRLRAVEEGKAAIDAMRTLVERMRTAHFDTAMSEGEYSRKARFGIALFHLQDLEGNNNYDRSIQHTLALRYRIELSDLELAQFVNYLASQDPHYPTWSRTAWYRDLSKRNEAGNPLQYRVVESVEPFYKAFLEFRAKSR
jgi:hypothetical protein